MDYVPLALCLLVIVGAGVWAYSRYRKHKLAAEARSRAALNRLLAEADEIEQRRLRDLEAVTETEADPDRPE